MNILLSSVGRRPYLVRWFCDALKDNEMEGEVIAADIDEYSPSRAFADSFVIAPRVDSEEYLPWLQEIIDSRDIDMAISINDFELSVWANLPSTEKWGALVRLKPEIQNLVEDKYRMGTALDQIGIRTPRTWLGREATEDVGSAQKDFVTKGRFGSASRGLQFVKSTDLGAAVEKATNDVTDRYGIPALEQRKLDPKDLVIVQERIDGVEYGLDVISDMNGEFVGVLARRKLAMRAGETDRAVSVSPRRFLELAEKISKAVPHQGSIDVDVIVDDVGGQYVIDVNPRLGGGYPFSHLAGARVPNAYVAWVAGKPVKNHWMTSREGVVGGKYVEAVGIS